MLTQIEHLWVLTPAPQTNLLFAISLLLTTIYLFNRHLITRRSSSPFPTVNTSSAEVQQNARNLITSGLANHNNGHGPITIALPHQSKIILPASLAGWVKSNKDLDHKELVRQDFFAGIPGFEAQSLLHHPNEMLINLIKTKLGPNNSTTAILNESLGKAFDNLWGKGTNEWRQINWQSDTMGIIARAASSVFVGPEKATDEEWLGLVTGYVLAYFTGVSELHRYPPWSRRLVHWFLPGPKACREYVKRVRVVMDEVVKKRKEEDAKAEQEGKSRPERNDALAWAQEASEGKVDPAEVQLALAMAAMFTTTELFRQMLVELARLDPAVVGELRQEVQEQVEKHGVSVAATSNMVLMDSFIKEAQRQSSGLVVLERFVSRDMKLPDGRILLRGSHIMVDSTNLWDPEVYPNPNQFNARRFLRRRLEGDKSSQFVQSSAEYNVFGGGRHICPGRFFASNELKLALAHILLKYEVRLAKDCEPSNLSLGFYVMVDPFVRLEMRRKDGSEESILN